MQLFIQLLSLDTLNHIIAYPPPKGLILTLNNPIRVDML